MVAISKDHKEIGTIKIENTGISTVPARDKDGIIKYGEWRKFHKGKVVDAFSGKTKPIFRKPQNEIKRYEW